MPTHQKEGNISNYKSYGKKGSNLVNRTIVAMLKDSRIFFYVSRLSSVDFLWQIKRIPWLPHQKMASTEPQRRSI